MCTDKMTDKTDCYYSAASLCLVLFLLSEVFWPVLGVWVTPIMVM